jgi:hypothetical protein
LVDLAQSSFDQGDMDGTSTVIVHRYGETYPLPRALEPIVPVARHGVCALERRDRHGKEHEKGHRQTGRQGGLPDRAARNRRRPRLGGGEHLRPHTGERGSRRRSVEAAPRRKRGNQERTEALRLSRMGGKTRVDRGLATLDLCQTRLQQIRQEPVGGPLPEPREAHHPPVVAFSRRAPAPA